MALTERDALEWTNRINRLFDFYGSLLTEKQVRILTYYFLENFSLGEIAAELGISRQAVYEHVKRGGQILEDYETKLGMLKRSEQAEQLLGRLEAGIGAMEGPRPLAEELRSLAGHLRDMLEPGAVRE